MYSAVYLDKIDSEALKIHMIKKIIIIIIIIIIKRKKYIGPITEYGNILHGILAVDKENPASSLLTHQQRFLMTIEKQTANCEVREDLKAPWRARISQNMQRRYLP